MTKRARAAHVDCDPDFDDEESIAALAAKRSKHGGARGRGVACLGLDTLALQRALAPRERGRRAAAACQEAAMSLELYRLVLPQLRALGMLPALRQEMGVARVLAWMEGGGVTVDTGVLRTAMAQLAARAPEVRAEAAAAAKCMDQGFDIGKPAYVVVLLRSHCKLALPASARKWRKTKKGQRKQFLSVDVSSRQRGRGGAEGAGGSRTGRTAHASMGGASHAPASPNNPHPQTLIFKPSSSPPRPGPPARCPPRPQKEVLEEMRGLHPVVPLILEHRKVVDTHRHARGLLAAAEASPPHPGGAPGLRAVRGTQCQTSSATGGWGGVGGEG